MQHERSINLITVHGFTLAFKQVGKVQPENIHHSYPGSCGYNSRESLLMWIMTMGCQQDKLPYAASFPGIEEIVQKGVQGLPAEARIAKKVSLCGNVDAIFYGGRAQHSILRRKIVSEVFNNDGVAAEWKVRSVLFARADRNDQACICGNDGGYLGWYQLFQAAWSGHWQRKLRWRFCYRRIRRHTFWLGTVLINWRCH